MKKVVKKRGRLPSAGAQAPAKKFYECMACSQLVNGDRIFQKSTSRCFHMLLVKIQIVLNTSLIALLIRIPLNTLSSFMKMVTQKQISHSILILLTSSRPFIKGKSTCYMFFCQKPWQNKISNYTSIFSGKNLPFWIRGDGKNYWYSPLRKG